MNFLSKITCLPLKKILTLLCLAAMFLPEVSAQKMRSSSPCGPGGCRRRTSLSSRMLYGKRKLENNVISQVRFSYLQGGILRHSLPLRALDEGTIRGGELAVEFPLYGGASWVYYWNFPTVGVATQYLHFGSSHGLGSAVTLYPYINLPLLHTRLFHVYARLGAGASYLTRRYNRSLPLPDDPIDYSANDFAIGAHVNAYLTGGLNFTLQFSRKPQGFWSHWSLTGGAAVHHYSSAGIRQPDAGIDAWTFDAGLKYTPYLTVVPRRSDLHRLPRKWILEGMVSAGVNRRYITDRLYPALSFSVGGFRPLANIYQMGLSVDGFYNTAFTASRTRPAYYAGDLTSPFRLGLSWGNELLMGRFTAGLHLGLYLINKETEHDGRVYLRLTTKYRVWDNLFVLAALKSHRTEVETLEVGVGYAWSKREKAPYSWIPEKTKKSRSSASGSSSSGRKSSKDETGFAEPKYKKPKKTK